MNRLFGQRRSLCQRSFTRVVGSSYNVNISCNLTSALYLARRAYYWPYNEDFVPRGADVSAFHSSSVPSVRERVLREYALSPLFGARTPCCVLGLERSARDIIEDKPRIKDLLCSLLLCNTTDVSLGATLQTREMMLYRGGTPESPRVADGYCTGEEAKSHRRQRYARQQVAARTLVEVFLIEDLPADDNLLCGQHIQKLLRLAEKVHSSPSSRENGEPLTDNDIIDEEQLAYAVKLLELGIVYCEIPPIDHSGFVFDELNGKPLDPDTVERVVGRWERRMRGSRMAPTVDLPSEGGEQSSPRI